MDNEKLLFLTLRGSIIDYKKSFLLYILEKNIFVWEDFLSTVKKMSCIENIRVSGVYGKSISSSNFRGRTKLSIPLDLA